MIDPGAVASGIAIHHRIGISRASIDRSGHGPVSTKDAT